MAYIDNKDTVELTSKDGKVYIIDFKKLVEYQKLNKGDTVHVVRKDVLKVGHSISANILRAQVPAFKTFLPDHLYITAQVTRAPFKKRNHLSLFQPARPSSQTICTSRRRSHAPPSRNAIILVCSSLQDLPPRPFVHHGVACKTFLPDHLYITAQVTRAPFKKRNHLSLFQPARPSSQTICTSRRRSHAPPSRNAIILVCSSLQDLPPRPFVHHGAACKTFLPDHLYITAQDTRAPFKKRNHLSLFQPERPSSQTICTSRRRSHAPPSRNAIILVCSSLQDLPPRPFVHHGAACKTFLPDHLYITAQETRAPFKKRNHLSLFQPARPSSQTICTSRRRSHAPPSRNAIILVCSSLQDLPPRPFVHHGAACKTFLPDHLYITAQVTRAPFKKRNYLSLFQPARPSSQTIACKTFLPDHLYITAQDTRAPFKKRNHLSLFQLARPSSQTICTSRRRTHAPPSRNAIILVCSSLQDLSPRPFVHHGAACKTFLPDHLYITAQDTRAPFKKRNHLSLFQPARPSSQTIVHHGAACKTFLPDHLYITAQDTRAPFKKRNHLSLFQPARPSSQTICTSRRRTHAPPSRNAIILVCSSLKDLPPRPFVHHGAACKTFLPDHLYITAQDTRAPFKKRNHLSLFQPERPSSQTICTSRRRSHAPPSRNAIILVCSSLQDLPPRPFVHHGVNNADLRLVRAVLLRRAVLGADMRPASFGTSVEIPRQSQNMAKKDLLLTFC
ncbi:hypothetical protein MAR_035529 [Mya arenaria]|uniref:Uncharacterized protein n=1 Tax=Mya arenaria TaxID=6604 RepID=A0ABY7EKD5_MYAAR|nr:hypothetical protein MAR_035529 [Mya arenaria]